MTGKAVRVQIVFAPLPEDEHDVDRSAAKEFALRAAEAFRAHTAEASGGAVGVEIETSHLADWGEDAALSASPTVVLLVVSCGPDGSVHRSVRKTTRWMKDRAPSASTTAAVALLGHAVCKTSSEQMEDEVYASGRRLVKALRGIAANGHDATAPAFRMETQVELEAPEEKFDGWVRFWVEWLVMSRNQR